MPSLSLSFDVLDVWDVGCFVYECFWMLHLNLPRSHWEDLYRPFVTCHLSPVTCHLSQCRTQCRGHRSHSWRCGRVHWWAVMRWTSGFLPSNLRMCSWRRAWVEIKFKLCRCLSLSSNKNLMHFESCFRITPLSSDAAFAERMRLALGTGVFEDQAQGRLTVITPLFPDEFKFGVITRDNQTMKLQVVMFDNWHLHLRGLWKQVWARSCDSNDWPVVGHSQLIILRCKIFQIWIDFFQVQASLARLGLNPRVCSTSCHQSPVYQRVFAADFNFNVWSFFLAGDPEECLSQWRRFSCPLDLSLGVWGRVSSQDVAKMGADKDFHKQAMQFTSSSLTATCQLCAVFLGDFQWQDSEHQRHDSSWIGVGLGFWESFRCCNIKVVMHLF